jgi:hypothetical protein
VAVRPRQHKHFSAHCARTGGDGWFCLRYGGVSPIRIVPSASEVPVSPAGPACPGSLFSLQVPVAQPG